MCTERCDDHAEDWRLAVQQQARLPHGNRGLSLSSAVLGDGAVRIVAGGAGGDVPARGR